MRRQVQLQDAFLAGVLLAHDQAADPHDAATLLEEGEVEMHEDTEFAQSEEEDVFGHVGCGL